MEQYLTFGTITLNVSTKVLAESCDEALKKIQDLINELNVNISNMAVRTVDGEVHNLEVSDFYVEWKEALE
jgi:hypothetical protein